MPSRQPSLPGKSIPRALRFIPAPPQPNYAPLPCAGGSGSLSLQTGTRQDAESVHEGGTCLGCSLLLAILSVKGCNHARFADDPIADLECADADRPEAPGVAEVPRFAAGGQLFLPQPSSMPRSPDRKSAVVWYEQGQLF
jgi:hypothetical protein